MTADMPYWVESDNTQMKKNGIEVFAQHSEGIGRWTATAHIHSSIEFLYMLTGSYRCIVDDEEFDASAGDLVMFPSSSIHRVYSLTDGSNDYLVIKIKPEIFVGLSGEYENSAYAMRFMLHTESKLVWRKEELEASRIGAALGAIRHELPASLAAHDVAMKIAVVSLLVAILRYDEACGAADSYMGNITVARQIYKAITYINRNYGKDITAADCAANVNMSYSYFSRTFKDVTKKTFKQYLNETRINHAEKELMLTDKSVTEICFSCGFGDVSYFIAQYKALRGKTPHKFRKDANSAPGGITEVK